VVDIKPLRSFPPLVNSDLDRHARILTAPDDGSRVVERTDEALVGVHDVVVCGGAVS
jgi:hypothetical protein